MPTRIAFICHGRPQQRGSKVPRNIRRRDGSLVTRANGSPVIVTPDANPKSKDWMACVRHEAAAAMGDEPPIDGPIDLSVVFYFARPKAHYGAKGLKPKAPRLHIQTPDVDKLVRCLGDALTGIVWRDDKQVCRLTAAREWTEGAERASVSVVECIASVPDAPEDVR